MFQGSLENKPFIVWHPHVIITSSFQSHMYQLYIDKMNHVLYILFISKTSCEEEHNLV